jgi:hypothetical protein
MLLEVSNDPRRKSDPLLSLSQYVSLRASRLIFKMAKMKYSIKSIDKMRVAVLVQVKYIQLYKE